jgi:hypothetical protein
MANAMATPRAVAHTDKGIRLSMMVAQDVLFSDGISYKDNIDGAAGLNGGNAQGNGQPMER